MKNVKVYLIIIFSVLLFGLLLGFLYLNNKEKEQIRKYFNDKESIPAISDVLSEQAKISDTIKEILNDGSYTFDNPYLIVDPYGISPLIIFQTPNEASIQVSINGVKATTMESSKIHSIPIYGLKVGMNNRVVLKMNDQEKEIMIDRTDVKISNLSVEKSNPKATLNNDLYFLSTPNDKGASAYDGEGNVVWRLKERYSLDIEFLDNGHMYLSNDFSSGLLDCYDGFYEIDYFGKIHKEYSMENGYHHELISLSDNTVIVAGGYNGDGPSYNASYIYQVNLENGKILNSFDVYDLFSKVDQDFANELLGKVIQVNSIYYDENSKNMILSLRGISSIISLNFDTKEINWIFGDASFYSEAFQKYMLHITDGSRLPKGQHTVSLTSDGYLSVFNNDFDMVHSTSYDIMSFKDNYSSATIYKIDGKNISTIWNYDANQQYFSYELGSFYTLEDHSKLINFGWTFYPFAFKPNLKIYDNLASTYGRIIELNDKDEEIFNAIYNGGIYRAYKHRMYEDVTANYLDFDYQLVNNNSNFNLEKIKTKDLFEEFDEAIDNPYEFELTTHTLTMNVGFDGLDVVDLYFVSEDYNTYLMHYKKMNEPTPSSLHLKLDGNYAVYFKINDVMYDTGKILSFD